jgi:hypothetical protein
MKVVKGLIFQNEYHLNNPPLQYPNLHPLVREIIANLNI